MSSKPEDTAALDRSSAPMHAADATLAGDGTLDTSPDDNGHADVTLAAPSTRSPDIADDDRTLAGEGTFADEPEGTVDGERTLFDDGAVAEDRTLPGDGAAARSEAADATCVEDPTLDEDRTLAEEARRRRRPPAEHDTFDDRTLAADGPEPPEADDRTLLDAGEAASRGVAGAKALRAPSSESDDRTLIDGPFSRAADADATLVGDVPASADDRTMIGDEPPHAADDRTMIGDEPPRNDDRTVMGEEPEPNADATEADAPSRGRAGKNPETAKVPEKNYDLLEDFARGGMGKIWRAMDLRIRREVAYKELLPNALKNPVVVERFLKEAQVTGQLEHPGIVPIYDLGWQDNGTPFYSMKLVRGTTFKKPIEEYHAQPRESSARRVAFVKVLQQFVAICNTLGYSHERGVLHRDLKPLNIMVGDFGETLVLDWGLARLMNDPDDSPMGDETLAWGDGVSAEGEGDGPTVAADGTPGRLNADGDATRADAPPAAGASVRAGAGQAAGATHGGATQSGSTQAGATQSGQTSGQTTTGARRQSVVTDYASEGSKTMMGSVMGTPAYMPPEQARGRLDQLDARSDIYSLGAILYEILTNRAPIPKGKLPEMLKMVAEGTIEPPRKIDPTIPRSLEAVCMKALSKEKAGRYATALELAREIERYLADEPVTAHREPWHSRAARWMRRHPTFVTTATAVVILAFLGWFLWGTIESRRIAAIERAARERIAQAKTAIQSATQANAPIEEFQSQAAVYREAAGLVASEPKLASLQDEIRNDLDDLAGLVASRVQAAVVLLREESHRTLDDAEKLAASDQLDEAVRRLTRADEKLAKANQPELAGVTADVRKRLAALTTQIAQRDAKAAAQAKVQRFLKEVDQTRFFGSLFTPGSEAEDSKSAQEHALTALRAYGLDQPGVAAPKPQFLSDEQHQELKESAFETLLILAGTEITLAGEATDEAKKTGAEKALGWLERAKELGVVAKVLPYREGVAWERIGDKKKSREAFRRSEQIEATTALDFFLMGQEYRTDGSIDDALNQYQQSLRVNPQYFWSLECLGLCQLRKERPEAALAAYTAAIAARPSEPICYLTRAIAYADIKGKASNLADRRNLDAALADLKKAEELKADPYELLINRGGVNFKFLELDAALADYEAAGKIHPDRPTPFRNIGTTLLVQADAVAKNAGPEGARPLLEKALAALTTAIRLAPNDAIVHSTRADVLVRLGRDAQAAADFEAAAQLTTSPAARGKAFYEVGLIHQRADRVKEALAAYDAALATWEPRVDDDKKPAELETPAVKKERADAHRLRAEALNKLGRLDEADAAWSKALALGAPIGDIYRGRALSRAARGKYRDAMSDYTRALELEPSANMLTRRGWAYLLQANKLALADFTQAIEENPENPDSYNGRGYARVMLGDYANAVSDAEEAVKREKAIAAKPAPDREPNWESYYNAATIFAQAVERIEKDKSKPDEDREKLANAVTLRALQSLAEAYNAAGIKGRAGFLNAVKTDTALDPIRQKPKFQQMFNPKPAKTE